MKKGNSNTPQARVLDVLQWPSQLSHVLCLQSPCGGLVCHNIGCEYILGTAQMLVTAICYATGFFRVLAAAWFVTALAASAEAIGNKI